MTKKVSVIKLVDQHISAELLRIGFNEKVSCRLFEHNVARHFSISHGYGTVEVAYYVALSNSKAPFAAIRYGIDCHVFRRLLLTLGNGMAEILTLPYAALGWSVGETGTLHFDPELSRSGFHFDLSEEAIGYEIGIIVKRLDAWFRETRSFLYEKPFYDFYRCESYIDGASRWREMTAILKILRGEKYVGIQLLHDLVDEAAGRRPHLGDYDSWVYKIHGLRRNERELDFTERLRSGVRASIANGAFAEARQFFDDSNASVVQQTHEK